MAAKSCSKHVDATRKEADHKAGNWMDGNRDGMAKTGLEGGPKARMTTETRKMLLELRNRHRDSHTCITDMTHRSRSAHEGEMPLYGSILSTACAKLVIPTSLRALLPQEARHLVHLYERRQCEIHKKEWAMKKWQTSLSTLTSQMSLKSCCSTLSSSHVDRVTTVLSRGKSCRMDSPKVAPTPRLHSVTGVWNTGAAFRFRTK
jgi:hypothetical protein